MDEEDFTHTDEAVLHTLVLTEGANATRRGAAQAELVRRQRAYERMRAEEDDRQQALRQRFDQGLEDRRQAHAEKIIKQQQDHAELIFKAQQEHAEKLALVQLEPATQSANATRGAAWAAFFSAIGTIVAAVFALLTYLDQHHALPRQPVPQHESSCCD